MNLHIVPDSTYINKFYENLDELGLLSQNRIFVRTNDAGLKFIKHDVSFGQLYSSIFFSTIGDTKKYQKVFIHYFSPLLYRWVATNNFQELNWMVWGGDLYNLSTLNHVCYEPLTLQRYIKRDWSVNTMLFKLKILITNAAFKKKAYSKVNNILTWMTQEYKFAVEHLPVNADYKFFFYENQLPYHKLGGVVSGENAVQRHSPLLIVGNSGSPTNNHLDIIKYLEDNRVRADLLVPISYGDESYIRFLKKNLRYGYGKLEFVDRHMSFDNYLAFLSSTDGLIMNTIRPQGYGNILMMMYLNKPVYFNERNISLTDLTKSGVLWYPIRELKTGLVNQSSYKNKEAILDMFSHFRLSKCYEELFGSPL